jgi:hypothetical protein
VLLCPLNIGTKQEVVENVVKALDMNASGFNYMDKKIPIHIGVLT